MSLKQAIREALTGNDVDAHSKMLALRKECTARGIHADEVTRLVKVVIHEDSKPKAMPKRPHADSVAQAGRLRMTPKTPLYDKFLEDLDATAVNKRGQELIDHIKENCFFGDLLYKNLEGNETEVEIPISMKMDNLLEKAKEKRCEHLASVAQPGTEKRQSRNT